MRQGASEEVLIDTHFLFTYFTVKIVYLVINLDGSYWAKLGKEDLKRAINIKVNDGVARNVIFFVGDGMGIPWLGFIRYI